ncbi:MAG: tetratricopeptide repeat protein [Flavobacteriales bacterium]
MPKQKGIFILLLISLGLVVLFLLLPKQPASVREKANNPIDKDSLKLMQAVELVNGSNPMEGIMMLREIIAEDENNVEAQYWLGVFSVRSGQLDKAVERFNKVIEIRPDYIAAFIDLGGMYVEMDSTEKGLAYFHKGIEIDSTNNYALLFSAQAEEQLGLLEDARMHYKQLLRHNTDTVVVKRVNEFINRIETTLNR